MKSDVEQIPLSSADDIPLLRKGDWELIQGLAITVANNIVCQHIHRDKPVEMLINNRAMLWSQIAE